MKVYVAGDGEINAAGFRPDRSLRFPPGTFEPVKTPLLADVILPGVDLAAAQDRKTFLRIPCVREYAARCALMDVNDNYTLYSSTAILIRGNLNQARLADSPNSLCLGWPVEDKSKVTRNFSRAVPLEPPGGFTHDVGFYGWKSPKSTRRRAYDSCRSEFGGQFDGEIYDDFSGYLFKDGKPLPEWTRRSGLFIDSLTRCRVQLCPESIDGVLPYRFLEAISAGRVAVLVGSNYVLPWREEIRYEDFCLFVPEAEAESAGAKIRAFLGQNSDAALIERGRLGRAAFERYLDWSRSPELQRAAVEKAARKSGLLS